jgi:hypothetical protein
VKEAFLELRHRTVSWTGLDKKDMVQISPRRPHRPPFLDYSTEMSFDYSAKNAWKPALLTVKCSPPVSKELPARRSWWRYRSKAQAMHQIKAASYRLL